MLLQPSGGIRYDDLVQARGDESVCCNSDVETAVTEIMEGFFCSREDWDLPVEMVSNSLCVDPQKCLSVSDGPARGAHQVVGVRLRNRLLGDIEFFGADGAHCRCVVCTYTIEIDVDDRMSGTARGGE